MFSIVSNLESPFGVGEKCNINTINNNNVCVALSSLEKGWNIHAINKK